jgi:hypothetical protein
MQCEPLFYASGYTQGRGISPFSRPSRYAPLYSFLILHTFRIFDLRGSKKIGKLSPLDIEDMYKRLIQTFLPILTPWKMGKPILEHLKIGVTIGLWSMTYRAVGYAPQR